nr:uncharacterized protein LOC104266468 isoform X1 [Ciona intestinalis]|eukprot:XP_026693743.1 uncharacterized protein LOC104266468 isoform X1 [Ciona intestinalis]
MSQVGKVRRSSLSSKDSMEEILVNQYREAIGKKQRNRKSKESEKRLLKNPYLQSVAPDDKSWIVQSQKRPMTAKPRTCPRRRFNSLDVAIPLGDSKEIEGDEHSSSFASDSESDSENSDNKENKSKKSQEVKISLRKQRPASAQVLPSRFNEATDPNEVVTPSHDLSKPLFKRQPYTITCNCYKNGQCENSVRVAAPSIKQLLEVSTQKLSLNMAARRVFLVDGREVFRPRDIPKDADVFISKGEPFRDPFKAIKNSRSLHSASTCSMKGGGLPYRRKVKPPGSKRLHELVGKHTQRVIIFRNGNGSESHEVVMDPQDGSSRFLDDCTQRLQLTSAARVLYEWSGESLSCFQQIEQIESRLTSSSSAVFGPLWVSKGEGFNPVGSHLYMESAVTKLRGQLQDARKCKNELKHALQRDYDKVTKPEILDLPDENIEATLDLVMADIDEFRNLIRKYKRRLEAIKEMVMNQSSEGHNYTMKHIKEIESNDRLVGEHGLRIEIFDNGNDVSGQGIYLNMRDVQRGAKGDRDLIKARFLEAVTSWHKPIDPSGPARSSVIRRLFNESGQEIMDVLAVKNDDKVWVSYGEDLKPCSVPALTVQLERTSAVAVVNDDGGNENKVYRETFDPTIDLIDGSDRFNEWELSEGYPMFHDFPLLSTFHESQQDNIQKSIQSSKFSVHDPFLQHKKQTDIVLRPKVTVEQKQPKKMLWPREGQTWIVNQHGQIYTRAFPSLALTLDTSQQIVTHYKDGTLCDGYAVTLQKKYKGNSEQNWGFSPEGNIFPLHSGKPDQQVLTYIDESFVSKVEDRASYELRLAQNNENNPNELSVHALEPVQRGPVDMTSSGLDYTVVVLERFEGQSSKVRSQRWAIKQESLAIPNQWKHTKVVNPVWKKLAYSWPVLPNGNWNTDYDWPLEGSILSNAPPLHNKKETKSTTEGSKPLKVYRNGEKDSKRFVMVVAPEMSKIEKEKSKTNKNSKRKPQKSPTKDSQQIEKLELTLFLERCTSLLSLPFAARRLFDSNGHEIASLRGLKRQQAVYVSVGDAWADPMVSKNEHQRRHLLAKLSHDISMIAAFCSLRNPEVYWDEETFDFVVEMERGATAGSRLILGKCSLSREKRQEISKKSIDTHIDLQKMENESSSDRSENSKDGLSAHEVSHRRMEHTFQSKKYPWQQQQTDSSDDQTKEKPKKAKKPKKKAPNMVDSNQQLVFKDGFISPASATGLALGVTGLDLDNVPGNVEVVLCKKSNDDPVQRWELVDGFIRLSCSHRLVLGVVMPPYKPGTDDPISYHGCAISVQHLKHSEFGRAHQQWLWDPVFNFLEPFRSNSTDKEITAANQVSICTYAVVGQAVINQEGYIIDKLTESPSNPVMVCCSCAKVIRGQYQLTKAPEQWSFSCAMGNARKNGLKQRGSFSCLNGKVDLSTYEAETTLKHWVSQLSKLRQETSLRLLNREIQSATTSQACRLLVMRNGEGRLKPGELIVGTTVTGILEQCTQRLSLGTAARRLYTSDGMHVLHIEQLIEWAVKNFQKYQQQQQMREIPREKSLEGEEPEGNPVSPDDGINSNEGTPDHLAAEADVKMTTSDLTKKLRPESAKRRHNSKSSEQLQPEMQEVPISTILRYPIEVWVSCGENFIPSSKAEKTLLENLKQQKNRNSGNFVLDTEKHVLRHMQGRRYKEMSPAELKATKSPQQPILLDGGWMETTKAETTRLERVHRLEEKISESRPLPLRPKSRGIDLNKDLYKQPNRKRVMVYMNGNPPSKSVFVWGETLTEILADATERFVLPRPARLLYNEEGKKVTTFDEVERDSLLCITMGDSLRGRPKHSNIEMKANWARVRKQRGPHATNIKVTKTQYDPKFTDVDPFGPPALATINAPASLAWEINTDQEN